jgi:isoquinoline 1-oxidoreductase subunit beta
MDTHFIHIQKNTMLNKVTIDRRRFVRSTLLGGGGLLLGFTMPGVVNAATILPPDCEFFQPNAFLRIDRKGGVTIFFAKQEIGQGVNTSLPMIIAEELEVDFQKVKTEIGPYGQYADGAHDTGGSQSVTGSWDELRKAGAIAKTMLIAAAAKRWEVDPGLCKAENGMVVNASTGQSFAYGDLACDAAKIPVPTDVTLKNVKDFKIIGKEQRKKNLKDMLSGRAKYGIDLSVPDMVYAVVERCPVLGGHLVSLDDREALKVPGVLKVVRVVGTGAPFHVHHGVAVIATHTWAAGSARLKNHLA